MPRRLRLLVAALALAALPAAAQEGTRWPPGDAVAERMRELHALIGSRDATLEEREAAREELALLLQSPEGRKRRAPAGARAPRAAIVPYPSVVAPVDVAPSSPPPAGVAELEVVEPPRATLLPRSGTAAAPSGGFAIDPRTGGVLHQAPGGYVDPRTGQFIPR